ncbi:MAG: 2-succinyl-5-enolpyruvyl-6-hydroxy-3-cyclohexene-1-carboxylic-acid synthase [Planctomycetota bacterium]|nr:MAG: 2-succinyl-5-enolpyruvyl-6-hydroxy-3-cyclohexene-1-carboxylic-acid synthase [Planctomycetota bacterium]
MRGAPNINLAWTMLAAEECSRLGMRHAVICPGSRSAPLAVAFARHADIAVHIAHDERGGAFLALAIGKATGVPAALIMTSGTAVANALPALVEARLTRTPLLLFAADRPPELRDCGANQAISQASLLDGAVRWSCDLPAPTTDIAAEYVLSTIDEAFARAVGDAGSQGGGVHLNWQFREPLAPEVVPWDIAWLWSIARWTRDARKQRAPWRSAVRLAPSEIVIDDAVIVAGHMTSTRATHALRKWRGTLLADVASGLACSSTVGADLVLRAAAQHPAILDALKPSQLVVIGDGVVSKRVNEWMSRLTCHTTVVGAGDPRVDSFHRANASIAATDVTWVSNRNLRAHRGWKRALHCATHATQQAFAQEKTLCEPVAIHDATTTAAALDGSGTMFYGSSMPIRDGDFLAIAPPSGWASASNRGASGIDGLIASATGHGLATARPVLAFIGDVSALHDINSLLLAAQCTTPLVLVVLNNDGGGIFRYLPIAKYPEFERCFATPHGLQISGIARALGVRCETPTTRSAMCKSVHAALRRSGVTVIEVVCTREQSEAARARIAAAAVAALAREFV